MGAGAMRGVRRGCLRRAAEGSVAFPDHAGIGEHPRTIQRDDAIRWLSETWLELGKADAALEQLEREAREVLSE